MNPWNRNDVPRIVFFLDMSVGSMQHFYGEDYNTRRDQFAGGSGPSFSMAIVPSAPICRDEMTGSAVLESNV